MSSASSQTPLSIATFDDYKPLNYRIDFNADSVNWLKHTVGGCAFLQRFLFAASVRDHTLPDVLCKMPDVQPMSAYLAISHFRGTFPGISSLLYSEGGTGLTPKLKNSQMPARSHLARLSRWSCDSLRAVEPGYPDMSILGLIDHSYLLE